MALRRKRLKWRDELLNRDKVAKSFRLAVVVIIGSFRSQSLVEETPSTSEYFDYEWIEMISHDASVDL